MATTRAQLFLGMMAFGLALVAACSGTRQVPARDGGPGHGGGDTGIPIGAHDVGVIDCTDNNHDLVPDVFEMAPRPGVTGDAVDDDMDGYSNTVESIGNYPGMCANYLDPTTHTTRARAYSRGTTPLIPGCHTGPDDCDADGISNMEDSDSDNDGLPDSQERMVGTDPCTADTDGDGYSDLVEVAAMTDPTSSTSTPPANGLYVTLPYYPPSGAPGPHVMRMFDFHTNIQQADVYILVDNSGSMTPIIDALRTTFSSTIVPGIRRAIPDARIGVGSFDSVPDGRDGDSGDYTMWARQRVDANAALSQAAFDNMHTIQIDRGVPGGCPCGGDTPEDQVEAIYEAIAGSGMSGHENDAPSNVTAALGGNGYVPRMNPQRDCGAAPDGPQPFGWACFSDGRVPIVVLASDAPWYQGLPWTDPFFGSTTQATDPAMHTLAEMTAAMTMHGAYFIGIDVGDTGDTLANSTNLATATGTVDGSGAPIVFHPGTGGIMGAANDIVNAISTIAGHTPQDITTRTDPDPNEHRLAAPHTTADFIKMVTADHADPDAPVGYDHKDATTFYHVNPVTGPASTPTIVYFNVDFYNDFAPSTDTAQLFRATIQVLGRARSIVDHRDVFIIVPPSGGQAPPS